MFIFFMFVAAFSAIGWFLGGINSAIAFSIVGLVFGGSWIFINKHRCIACVGAGVVLVTILLASSNDGLAKDLSFQTIVTIAIATIGGASTAAASWAVLCQCITYQMKKGS